MKDDVGRFKDLTRTFVPYCVDKRDIFQVMLEKDVEKLSERALKILSPSADNSESQLRQ